VKSGLNSVQSFFDPPWTFQFVFFFFNFYLVFFFLIISISVGLKSREALCGTTSVARFGYLGAESSAAGGRVAKRRKRERKQMRWPSFSSIRPRSVVVRILLQSSAVMPNKLQILYVSIF
jgi:hypothetical protein